MNENSKRIRKIAFGSAGLALKAAGFRRHGADFSRQYGDAVHVVNIQLNRHNTQEEGSFTLNVGVDFASVRAMLGKEPMPTSPRELLCLMRVRVGRLMPLGLDHWWTVKPNTDGDVLAQAIAEVCSSHVLPWLERFKNLSEVNWNPPERVIGGGGLVEASARLVLGEREKAARCVETYLAEIQGRSQDERWKAQLTEKARAWAVERGLSIRG